MRLLNKLMPGVVIDAAIIGALFVGSVVVVPSIIYSMLMKDGVFHDD